MKFNLLRSGALSGLIKPQTISANQMPKADWRGRVPLPHSNKLPLTINFEILSLGLRIGQMAADN